MKVTANSDALVAHLEGEAVLLHAGTREYFRLNETAQHVWRLVESGAAVDDIVASLVAAFDVDEPAARAETDRLIAELEAAGLVDLSDA